MSQNVAPAKSRKIKDVDLPPQAKWNGNTDAFFGTNAISTLLYFHQSCTNANLSAKAMVQLMQSAQFYGDKGRGQDDRLVKILSDKQVTWSTRFPKPNLILPHNMPSNTAERRENVAAETFYLDTVEEEYYGCLLKHMYRAFIVETVPRNVGDRINKVVNKVPPQRDEQSIRD